MSERAELYTRIAELEHCIATAHGEAELEELHSKLHDAYFQLGQLDHAEQCMPIGESQPEPIVTEYELLMWAQECENTVDSIEGPDTYWHTG